MKEKKFTSVMVNEYANKLLIGLTEEETNMVLEEFSIIDENINKINPYGISIVDTLGNMYEKQVVEMFVFIDKILNPQISLGFHSHNSMQLSFSNAKALLKMNLNLS